jgi:hypothetical protein
MNHANEPTPPDDATLVAWLDGELDARAAAAAAAAVERDEALRTRVRLLRAARAELVGALTGGSDAAPLGGPEPQPMHRARRGMPAFAVVVAAAAIAVVVVVASLPRTPRAAADENDWLRVELHAPATASLFSGIAFELEGTAKRDGGVHLLARGPNESDEQLVQRFVAQQVAAGAVPVVLDATITGPDGIARSGPVARVSGRWTKTSSRVQVELVDVRLQHPSIPPVLTVALAPGGPREDHVWVLQRAGLVQPGAVVGFVPEQPGDYRVRLELRSLVATGDARWPAFAPPLAVERTIAVHGVVGAWSEPVDGMRARIVASTDRPAADRALLVAVQLRNDSDRPRSFNVTGTTIAKIPQPMHFDLTVDGVPWRQRDRLPVVTAAMSTGLALPVGAQRSVVALADYWQRDGAPPSAALTGRHRLALRFHFEASVWTSTDRELWQGRIDAPPVEVDFGGR